MLLVGNMVIDVGAGAWDIIGQDGLGCVGGGGFIEGWQGGNVAETRSDSIVDLIDPQGSEVD